MLARNSSPQTELELCFRRTEERLVDGGRVRVKSDVRSGGVRVTLKHDLFVITDLEASTELRERQLSCCLVMRAPASLVCLPK